MKNIKEKIIGSAGSISGIASILGSWQVCHNVCLGLIAILSVLGITLVGMPLAFLTKIAVPVWSVAVVFLVITALLHLKKKCISGKLLTFNSGLIIAGIPFFTQLSTIFMSIGGVVAFTGIALFIKDKLTKKRCCKNE